MADVRLKHELFSAYPHVVAELRWNMHSVIMTYCRLVEEFDEEVVKKAIDAALIEYIDRPPTAPEFRKLCATLQKAVEYHRQREAT